MIEIEAPDGTIVEFPDGTTRDVMTAAMRKTFGGPQADTGQVNARVSGAFDAASQPDHPSMQDRPNTYNPVAGGVLLGFDDELSAAILSPIEATKNWAQGNGFDLGAAYTKLQADFDADKQTYRREHPVRSFSGEVAGGGILGGGLAKGGVTLAGRMSSMPARLAAGSTEGAAYGAVIGAGESRPGERIEGAKTGAYLGALTGGITEGVAGGIVRRKIAKEALPAADDLRVASKELYGQMEEAGVRIKPIAFGKFIEKATDNLGLVNPHLHPKTSTVLKILDQYKNRSVSLPEFEQVRRVINDAAAGADPDDARMLRAVVGEIDQFVDGINPNQATGDMRGARALKEARELWKKKAKIEVVDDLIERARNQATGFENGLRIQFRSLANSKDRFSRFSQKEQAAIRHVVRGGPVENALRAMGWLSPTGHFGMLLTGGVGVGAGVMPGAVIAGAGYAGRKGAEAITRKNVDAVKKTIATKNHRLPAPASRPSPLIGATTQSGNAIYRLLADPQLAR